ncbi:hypothetical protein COCOBI_05-4510 [Coccomyxa sp. Obi]|nr:hypothetical protein COCOBI_05-4510 [Coccomyxa sp. Obi]
MCRPDTSTAVPFETIDSEKHASEARPHAPANEHMDDMQTPYVAPTVTKHLRSRTQGTFATVELVKEDIKEEVLSPESAEAGEASTGTEAFRFSFIPDMEEANMQLAELALAKLHINSAPAYSSQQLPSSSTQLATPESVTAAQLANRKGAVEEVPHQREHFDVFLEHCAVEAKAGNKMSIDEELDIATRFLRIHKEVGKTHHTHASLVPWSQQPHIVEPTLAIQRLPEDMSSRPSRHSRQVAETLITITDAPCQNHPAPIPQMMEYPLGVYDDAIELMELGWYGEAAGSVEDPVPGNDVSRRWRLRDLFSFGRS